MAREIEKMHKELEAFIDAHGDKEMTEGQLNDLLNAFMGRYNANLPKRVTPATAKTSDDYLELAENAENAASALRYARMALELNPDNLDAERIVVEVSAKEPLELVEGLEQAVKHGTKVMTSGGFMDDESIGHFWGLVETRPYMRLRQSFVEALITVGMMRKAAEECEEMIRLCENDNLGIRFTLMHLYAYLEEEKPALKLLKKYDGYDDTQMTLALSMLYYKLFRMDKAKEYLDKLAKVNKDTKKFLRAIRQGKLDQHIDQMEPFGYRPFTIDELITTVTENSFLYATAPEYMRWADKQLNGKKK